MIETIVLNVNPDEEKTRKFINIFQLFGWQLQSTQRCEDRSSIFNVLTFNRNRPDENQKDADGKQIMLKIIEAGGALSSYYWDYQANPEPVEPEKPNIYGMESDIDGHKISAILGFAASAVLFVIAAIAVPFLWYIGGAGIIYGIVKLIQFAVGKADLKGSQQKYDKDYEEYKAKKVEWNKNNKEKANKAMDGAEYLQKLFGGYGIITTEDILLYEGLCLNYKVKPF